MKKRTTIPNVISLGILSLCCMSTSAYSEVYTAPTVPTQQEVYSPPVWNDTYIGYRYGQNFHYPGVPGDINENIGYLTTTGAFKFGSYAFNVDYSMFNSVDPEAGGPSNGGAQDVYSVGRVELSAGRILGKNFSVGPVRDFGLTVGYEFGVGNDYFGERTRMFVVGPTIEFSLPRGYANITVGIRTESNHSGIAGTDLRFNTAWHVEGSWLYPFRVGPLPLVLRGFASLTGPKGPDAFGVKTTTEFLTRVSLLADLGELVGHPRMFFAGVGYEYWLHEYGTRSSEISGTKTSTPMLMAEFHF